MKRLLHFHVAILFFVLIAAYTASGQGNAFTYNGSFNENGSPANGTFNFQFALFDAPTGGTQIGSTLNQNGIVVSGGVFSATLDFGMNAFPGTDRYLEIGLCHVVGAGCEIQTQSPRVRITAVPYAMRAQTVSGPVVVSLPGIQNPSLVNLPPAALVVHETASNDVTAGLIGISDSASGSGVFALADTASPTGQSTGLTAIATASSGQTRGVAASVFSPQGVAYSADAENGAQIFSASNGTNYVFTVDNAGNVSGRDFANLGGTFEADNHGDIRAHGINVGPVNGLNDVFVVQPDGTTSVAGTFHVGSGLLDVNPTGINMTGNVGITGGATANSFSASGNSTFGAVDVTNLTVSGGLNVNGASGLLVSGDINANGNLGASNITAHSGATVTGTLTVNGDLHITGAKNNIVKTENGESLALYAMESPEYWFEDFGTVRLVNGRVVINIDPKFAQTVNLAVPYKVFLTPDGNCRGLYVFRKGATSFEVRELRGGRSNISFDYRVVAKRLHFEDRRLERVQTPAGTAQK